MLKRSIHTFSVFFLFLLAPYLQAQQYSFTKYSLAEGLSQSTAYCLLQDSRGYLWIGTNGNGINRFDGKNFIEISKKNGLAGNIVRTIFEDKKGNIWVGTDGGISIFNGYNIKNITNSNGLRGSVVLCVNQDSIDNYWVGTNDGGLNRLNFFRDSITIKTFGKDEGLRGRLVFNIQVDSLNRLWLSTVGGVNLVTQNKDSLEFLHFIEERGEIPSNMVITASPDNNGDLVFGTYDAGVFRIKAYNSTDKFKVTGSFNTISEGNNFETVWSILPDSENNIWFCTDKKGIIFQSGNKIVDFNENNGLPENQVLSSIQDSEGNIWFGTFSNGICRFSGFNFVHYAEDEGFGEPITSIIQAGDNSLLFASEGAGILQSELINGQLAIPETILKEASLFVNDMFYDKTSQTIWIATADRGVFKVCNGVIENFNSFNGLTNNTVSCIHVDSKKRLWAGTKGGLSILIESGFKNFTENSDPKLVSNEVQTIIEDREKTIWIGTLNGLVSFTETSMTNYDEVEGLNSKKIHCLAEDYMGNIWIGTFGGGVFKFDKELDTLPIQKILDDNSILSNNVYSLLFYNDTTLLCGTDRGLNQIGLNKNMHVKYIRSYSRSEGFIGTESNINSIFKDKDNNVWIGTKDNLTQLKIDEFKEQSSIKNIEITNIQLNYEEVNWISTGFNVSKWFNVPLDLKLKHNENKLSIVYRAIYLTNPDKIIYSYRTKESEKWSPSTKENSITLPGLTSGKYTFQVRASIDNIVWSQPASFSFIIKPPVWKTWWFILVTIFIILTGFISLIKTRERKLLRDKQILEETVKKRTQEIREQKTRIERQKQELTDSIEYAKKIQEAVISKPKDVEKYLSEYFILFLPRDIVSGDFYWFGEYDNKFVFSVADCTGHGVPGAFMSMLGIRLLNEIVLERGVTAPNKILNQLRAGVIQALQQGGEISETRDGMDIALCTFDPVKSKLYYSGAYNSLWLMRDGEIETYKADRMPVAVFDKQEDFTCHEIDCKKGDQIYIFSDGYPDQFGGDNLKKYMSKNLREKVVSISNLPMEQQKEKLLEEFYAWKGDTEQIDDVTLLGVKI
ncbi:MAG: SpoIIE family protein phosphatase [Bacteroidales bacterium]|nr:SpoIIE family protein phosphatase [Bacteroidales bacterium]MBN2817964.1 SpoIIE family protein phosphatase [Bacteroidales bacterium]